jgi:hypothetical protein
MEGVEQTKIKYTHSGDKQRNKDRTIKEVECVLGRGGVGMTWTCGTGKGEWRRLRWGYMVDGLHILTWTRTKKPLAIALSGSGREVRGREDGDDLTNVQYKPNQNCHYESPSV